MKDNKNSRRDFFRKAAGAAAGLAGLSALGPSCAESAPKMYKSRPSPSVDSPSKGISRIVVARDAGIWSGAQLDLDKVKKLLFRAVRKFTGKDDDHAAWSLFFSPGERVSMKLNCIAGKKLSSTPALAGAIAAGAVAAGVKPGNIIGWDRTNRELRRAGFPAGRDASGIRYLGTDTAAQQRMNFFDYDYNLTIAGEVGSRVARIASVFSDAIVNVPVLKDHDLVGVSGALKNYFGAINNPNKLHENGCDPYVADLNTMPVFRDKTRLIVCDGTLAQYHAGPGYKPAYAWKFSGIIVGTDPVALDTVAWRIIEEKRAGAGLPTLEEEGRPPRYIASAADPSRALGTNDWDSIELIEI